MPHAFRLGKAKRPSASVTVRAATFRQEESGRVSERTIGTPARARALPPRVVSVA